jgi:tol-pal system protein YbgF
MIRYVSVVFIGLAVLTASSVAPAATIAGVAEAAAVNSASLADLAHRLDRIERMLNNKVMLEMLQRVEALQQEVRELRGELEQQGFEQQSMRNRQRDLYLDSDRRLRDLELISGSSVLLPLGASDISESESGDSLSGLLSSTGVLLAAPDGLPTGSSTGTTANVALAPIDPIQEKAAYIKAFNYLKEGRYEGAIKAFSRFLLDYPSGNYADNAQYWLGESNYVSRFFVVAIQEFNIVVVKHPASPKVSDARLKIGYAYYELENWEKARSVLSALVSDYANSSVARLANKRLARMRDEGH